MEQHESTPSDADVISPESVAFSYDVAGLGSRFAAVLVDVLLQVVMLVGALIAAAGAVRIDLALFVPGHVREMGLTLWVWAGLVLASFAILWGYFVFFEMMWNGQSPGKRLFGLRVVRAGGYPVDFLASAVRNLVRYVDFLPGAYSAGAITMLLSRQWQRLGDYAAGTLVVRDRRLAAPEAFSVESRPRWEEALGRVDEVTAQEYQVVREFLRRRGDLEADSRSDLARRIADPLLERLGVELGAGPEARERFLEALAAAYRSRFG
jgi:uncharacterized RDD family membrane protein YckC